MRCWHACNSLCEGVGGDRQTADEGPRASRYMHYLIEPFKDVSLHPAQTSIPEGSPNSSSTPRHHVEGEAEAWPYRIKRSRPC